ncbi:MAG TPA: YafY family protein [Phototrophicaceae bacterium]|jgi:predicted DNA-binding transcriptional regulator YafY|nr:YafY family protein [Phototrophicaceae bacterium]
MRADRLLSIMLLLQVNQRLTARELSDRLEVSERTIYRDMDALSTAGIPVTAERGTNGGWSLLEEYRTNLNGLNQSEIYALFLNQSPRLLQDLGLTRASDAASLKLLAALPDAHRENVDMIRQRIYIDSAGWKRWEEAIPMLPVIQTALWGDRKLWLCYLRGDGKPAERRVDPLGLVAKGSIWYLVAAVEGEPRTYRISRVQDAALMDEACIRPEGFDLASYWQESSAQFLVGLPQYPAVIRVSPEIIPRLQSAAKFARVEQIHPPEADGWSRVDILFEVLWEATEYVLSLGEQIEVLEPAELRQRVTETALKIVALYGTGQSGYD